MTLNLDEKTLDYLVKNKLDVNKLTKQSLEMNFYKKYTTFDSDFFDISTSYDNFEEVDMKNSDEYLDLSDNEQYGFVTTGDADPEIDAKKKALYNYVKENYKKIAKMNKEVPPSLLDEVKRIVAKIDKRVIFKPELTPKVKEKEKEKEKAKNKLAK